MSRVAAEGAAGWPPLAVGWLVGWSVGCGVPLEPVEPVAGELEVVPLGEPGVPVAVPVGVPEGAPVGEASGPKTDGSTARVTGRPVVPETMRSTREPGPIVRCHA